MKYTFHHYSRLHYAMLLLLPMILFIPVCIIIFSWEGYPVIIPFITATILFSAIAIYLPKKLTKSTIEATINIDLLILDWVKPAWGSQLKTIRIYFKDIISYKYEYSSNLHLFKLTLADGSVIKINRGFEDDDFDIFYHQFEQMVGNFNSQQHNQPIIRERRLNEKPGYLISMTILSGLGFIGTFYLTFFRNEDDPKKIFVVIILAIVFISFLVRTITILRRRSNNIESI